MKQKDPLIAGLFVFRLSEITGYPFAQERERVNRYKWVYIDYVVDKFTILCYTYSGKKARLSEDKQ